MAPVGISRQHCLTRAETGSGSEREGGLCMYVYVCMYASVSRQMERWSSLPRPTQASSTAQSMYVVRWTDAKVEFRFFSRAHTSLLRPVSPSHSSLRPRPIQRAILPRALAKNSSGQCQFVSARLQGVLMQVCSIRCRDTHQPKGRYIAQPSSCGVNICPPSVMNRAALNWFSWRYHPPGQYLRLV